MSLEDGFVLDTSDLTPSMLKAWIRQFINAPASEMTISFESFAFKKGIPVAADFVFDVRNLPNPYYDTALRPLTGQDMDKNCGKCGNMIVSRVFTAFAGVFVMWKL